MRGVELPWERPEQEWRRLSLAALAGWLAFYALFLLHAATSKTGFLILDNVNLMIHEAGHLFFSFFGGETITILGGTLGELIVPLLLGLYFWWRRHTAAVAFCSFWFFENFLYIGTYMMDVTLGRLQLIGSGEHDWEILFTKWGLVGRDLAVGAMTRRLGWLGMLATVGWLIWMARRTAATAAAGEQDN